MVFQIFNAFPSCESTDCIPEKLVHLLGETSVAGEVGHVKGKKRTKERKKKKTRRIRYHKRAINQEGKVVGSISNLAINFFNFYFVGGGAKYIP